MRNGESSRGGKAPATTRSRRRLLREGPLAKRIEPLLARGVESAVAPTDVQHDLARRALGRLQKDPGTGDRGDIGGVVDRQDAPFETGRQALHGLTAAARHDDEVDARLA